MSAPLDGIRVVEVAGSLAGTFAAHQLRLLGASVTVVEPATWALRANPDAVAVWLHGKTSATAGSRAAMDALAAADVAFTSDDVSGHGVGDPAGLGVSERCITATVTPFGTDGPYARWVSADIVEQAIAGHLYLSGRLDREPLIGPANQAALAAGVWAAIGIVGALIVRDRNGGPVQHIDVTHHEALAALHQFTDVRWTHAGNVLQRMGNRYAGPGSPIGMYRASDGWIAFTVATAAHGEMLLTMIDRLDLLELPGVTSVLDVMLNPSILDPALNAWLAERTVAEAVDLLQAVRIAVGPVLTMRQMLEDPQLASRDWWEVRDGMRVPGPPFHITANDTATRAIARTGPLPLSGVRVLDLTRVWAGPLAARILTDLGADVVMVEALWQRTPLVLPQSYVDGSHFYPNDDQGTEPWNSNGFINKFALGKRSVGLDLAVDEGRAVFEQLVRSVDVVVENFSPRVMPNLGFDERRLHEINPALIYLTMPGYGRSGPAADYSAYGPVLDSHAGLSTLMGYRDVDAWKCGIAWPDPVGGIHGALATLAALYAGRGATIEIAQFETAVTMIADRIVRAQREQADPAMLGNRHPERAPQGVFRCAGDDRWVALTAPDDDAWRSICSVAALPADWALWPVSARRERHDQIDDALSAWTATQSGPAVAEALQSAGVPAAPVTTGEGLLSDPQLRHRSFFHDITHPVAGTHAWHGLSSRLSATPAQVRGPAPCLGQHNHEVLTEWAGLSDADVERLAAAGVIGTRPPA